MHKKDRLTSGEALLNKYQPKTATDNQWTSLTQSDEENKGKEKTATDNQWVSTNKNVKE